MLTGAIQERDTINKFLQRKPEDVLNLQTQYAGSFNPGGGDPLSSVLANRLESAYSTQLSDLKNKYARNAPITTASLNNTLNDTISANYADVKRKEAEIEAARQAKKAKRKALTKGLTSLAGMAAGAYLGGPALGGGAAGGLAGAQIGGGVGGLIGG